MLCYLCKSLYTAGWTASNLLFILTVKWNLNAQRILWGISGYRTLNQFTQQSAINFRNDCVVVIITGGFSERSQFASTHFDDSTDLIFPGSNSLPFASQAPPLSLYIYKKRKPSTVKTSYLFLKEMYFYIYIHFGIILIFNGSSDFRYLIPHPGNC